MRLLNSIARLRSCERGTSLVEFTIVFPLFLSVVMGVIEFGLILNNQNALTNAVASGARQLSISRGTATPFTLTTNAVRTGATSILTTANITVTVAVNGVTCATDATCATSLNAAKGQAAMVTATYPCVDLGLVAIHIGACRLRSSLTMSVQ